VPAARRRVLWLRGLQVGPSGGHRRSGAVWQRHEHVEDSTLVTQPQHIERHALEGVPLACDRHFAGGRMGMGSLSGSLLPKAF
jgi:hypothetical protein